MNTPYKFAAGQVSVKLTTYIFNVVAKLQRWELKSSFRPACSGSMRVVYLGRCLHKRLQTILGTGKFLKTLF